MSILTARAPAWPTSLWVSTWTRAIEPSERPRTRRPRAAGAPSGPRLVPTPTRRGGEATPTFKASDPRLGHGRLGVLRRDAAVGSVQRPRPGGLGVRGGGGGLGRRQVGIEPEAAGLGIEHLGEGVDLGGAVREGHRPGWRSQPASHGGTQRARSSPRRRGAAARRASCQRRGRGRGAGPRRRAASAGGRSGVVTPAPLPAPGRGRRCRQVAGARGPGTA